jgi:hypothetical protein
VKAARPRSEGEVSCGNTGIDSNCRRDGGGHPAIDSLTGKRHCRVLYIIPVLPELI